MGEFKTNTVWSPDHTTPEDVMDEIKDLWEYFSLNSDSCWYYITNDQDFEHDFKGEFEMSKMNEYLKSKGITEVLIRSYW